ncbi:hypothetical protein [Dysgonomonas sp. GY617]|uniref:hypothetical protein n=1 Tax=Dysgonomonas sp. GY617 TaxID=2780420 RepID=UPI0018835C92|nr:hypothetical protein [Dysgonomonas sp. GY617]MBF0574660.1 hypothetical protein [Dysgonomonas sp. GY617]
MKKTVYFIALAGSLLCTISISSQIGIKTDYPRSLFHIDAAGDNAQNSSATLTEAQISNDVVMSSDGKLGIGVLNPQTKLDIVNNKAVTGVDSGLRLTPGYGSPSILALQPDGVTNKWEANPSLGQIGYFTATVGQSFSYGIPQRVKLSPQSGSIILTNETEIRVPTEGRYLFTLTITGLSDVRFPALSGMSLFSLYVYLSRNDTLGDDLINNEYYPAIGNDLMDVIEFYQAVNPPDFRAVTPAYMSFTTSLYAGYCKPSDFFTIRFSPTIGFSQNPITDVFKINPDCKILITIYNI